MSLATSTTRPTRLRSGTSVTNVLWILASAHCVVAGRADSELVLLHVDLCRARLLINIPLSMSRYSYSLYMLQWPVTVTVLRLAAFGES